MTGGGDIKNVETSQSSTNTVLASWSKWSEWSACRPDCSSTFPGGDLSQQMSPRDRQWGAGQRSRRRECVVQVPGSDREEVRPLRECRGPAEEVERCFVTAEVKRRECNGELVEIKLIKMSPFQTFTVLGRFAVVNHEQH